MLTSIINILIPSPLCTGFFADCSLLSCVANGSPGQIDTQNLLLFLNISNYDANLAFHCIKYYT